jgi:hypothetical protein
MDKKKPDPAPGGNVWVPGTVGRMATNFECLALSVLLCLYLREAESIFR